MENYIEYKELVNLSLDSILFFIIGLLVMLFFLALLYANNSEHFIIGYSVVVVLLLMIIISFIAYTEIIFKQRLTDCKTIYTNYELYQDESEQYIYCNKALDDEDKDITKRILNKLEYYNNSYKKELEVYNQYKFIDEHKSTSSKIIVNSYVNTYNNIINDNINLVKENLLPDYLPLELKHIE